MFYNLIKIPAEFAIRLYCRNIAVNNKEIFRSRGPILIASNHPNSFLDAIILATLFKRPVYSLARGDAFKKKLHSSLLGSLNMLPVYRMSEGAENLEQNYDTFEKCKEIFKQNGIVLIFSEGRCINEWKLRPLKKGTARLAISSWQDGIPLTIIPAGINYQSFTSFGKNIQVNFGCHMSREDISITTGYGNSINDFNEKLTLELKNLVVEVPAGDTKTLRKKFEIKIPAIKKILLSLPAFTGYILHAPLYIPIQKFCWKKARHVDHYDSVLVGLLFVLYPCYLMLAALIIQLLIPGYWWLSAFLLLPFFAWSFVQLKRQF